MLQAFFFGQRSKITIPLQIDFVEVHTSIKKT